MVDSLASDMAIYFLFLCRLCNFGGLLDFLVLFSFLFDPILKSVGFYSYSICIKTHTFLFHFTLPFCEMVFVQPFRDVLSGSDIYI